MGINLIIVKNKFLINRARTMILILLQEGHHAFLIEGHLKKIHSIYRINFHQI